MVLLETSDKYYYLNSCYDLLEDLVIICDFGSKFARRSYRHNIKVDDIEEMNRMIDKIILKRIQRGYTLTYDNR